VPLREIRRGLALSPSERLQAPVVMQVHDKKEMELRQDSRANQATA